jgi:hypothetical protein
MPCGTKLKPFTGIVKTTELPHGGFVDSVKALDTMQKGSMKPPKASLKRGRRF